MIPSPNGHNLKNKGRFISTRRDGQIGFVVEICSILAAAIFPKDINHHTGYGPDWTGRQRIG